MLTNEQIEQAVPKLRIIQIIAAAILFGAILFALVVMALIEWEDFTPVIKMMTLIGALTGFSMFGLSWIVPSLIASSTTQIAADVIQDKDHPQLENKILTALLESLSTNWIVFYAILEGAIFLNLITFMLERSVLSLVVVSIGFLAMLIGFPTKPRLLNWLHEQLKSVKEEMQLIR